MNVRPAFSSSPTPPLSPSSSLWHHRACSTLLVFVTKRIIMSWGQIWGVILWELVPWVVKPEGGGVLREKVWWWHRQSGLKSRRPPSHNNCFWYRSIIPFLLQGRKYNTSKMKFSELVFKRERGFTIRSLCWRGAHKACMLHHCSAYFTLLFHLLIKLPERNKYV